MRQCLSAQIVCSALLLGCAAHRTKVAAASAETEPDQPWRAQPPPPGAPPAIELPAFDRSVLPSGLTVLLSTSHDLPLVRVALVCRAGSAQDPPLHPGLAELTMNLLLEGAGGRDARQLGEAFLDLGATPEIDVGPDGGTIGVTVLATHARAALALLADLITRPTLDTRAFERVKARQLATLALHESDPRFAAEQALLPAAYGGNHPYGHVPIGTLSGLQTSTLEDVRVWLQRAWGPSTLAITLTGDVTVVQALPWVNELLGNFRGDVQLATPPWPIATPSPTQLWYVERPGLDQTTLLLGRPTVAAGSEDEPRLLIATAVLGGMFSSRLNLNLRERHGYAYGSRSALDPRCVASPWLTYSAVRADATAAALQEIWSELGRLPIKPIHEQESEEARRGLRLALPNQLAGVESLADAAAQIYDCNLPIDRYVRLAVALNDMPVASVQEVALRYLRPSMLTVVAVGDPEVLAKQLGEVRLDPPRVLQRMP